MTFFNIYRRYRIFIKSNPLLYKFVAKNLREQAEITEKDSSFVIEGFQRSGNTFAWQLVREMYKNQLKIAHHTHSVASLKLAIKYNKKIIILIRKPLDSLVSAMIYRANYEKKDEFDKILKLFFDDYKSFYNFLKKIKKNKNVFIVDFNELITNPKNFCREVSGFLNLKSEIPINNNFIDRVIKKQIIDEEERGQNKLMSTQFNLNKNSLKPKVRKEILINQFISLGELTSIYQYIKFN